MSVLVKVEELVVPLCDDSNCIFEKGNHDEETPDSRYISV